MRDQSLEQLEDARWGDAPPDATYLIATVHELRRKPIGLLDAEDLRLLLGQREGVPFLVPLAIELLERDPLTEGDFHPGDLLSTVLRRVPAEYWAAHPDESARLDAVVTEVDDEDLRPEIVVFCEARQV